MASRLSWKVDMIMTSKRRRVSGAFGWARVRPPGAHYLRRGAWYPVVNDSATSLVVLDVARRNVAVSRGSVELRRDVPDTFSVVIRSPEDPKPGRINGKYLGLTYAVCPRTRARVGFEGRPDTLECPVCGGSHAVDWEVIC
jgi:hypothetical protein